MIEQSISDSRTAWRVIAVSTIAVFMIFGIRLSFSVFYAEFTRANGWSSSAAASIFSLNMLFFAVSSAPAGVLLDRLGPRIMFSLGALLLGLSLYLSSLASEILFLQLSYGVLGGIALGMIGLGQMAAVVGGWMPQRRGLAIGLTFAGTGMGSLIFVPLSERLIDWLGWQQAYFTLAAMCILILAPLLAIGERKPPVLIRAKDTPAPPRRELLRDSSFWWLMLLSFTTMGPLRSLTVHQIAYLEEVGIDRHIAAQYVGIAGFLTAGTFIAWGYISDRFGRGRAFLMGAVSLILATGILFWMDRQPETSFLLFYAILLALGEGSRSSQTTALASDTFRERGLGFINGLVGAMFGAGAALSPWLVGYLRDISGSYEIGLELIVLLTIISMISFSMVLIIRQKKRPYHFA